jgi:hypothetical protein
VSQFRTIIIGALLVLTVLVAESCKPKAQLAVHPTQTEVPPPVPEAQSTESDFRVFDTAEQANMYPPKQMMHTCAALKMGRAMEATDFFVLDSVWTEGGCMGVQLTYSGGCGEAQLDTYWSGAIMKSYPPTAVFELVFTKVDDCEALITQTYYFDLDELRKTAGNRCNLVFAKLNTMLRLY